MSGLEAVLIGISSLVLFVTLLAMLWMVLDQSWKDNDE